MVGSPETERKLILNGNSVGPARTNSLLLEGAVCIPNPTNALQIAQASKTPRHRQALPR
jgi:hypothetical protein